MATVAKACAIALMALCTLGLSDAAAAGDTEISWYGYFKTDLAYDSARSSHGNFAMWTRSHADGDATAVTSLTARQTRIGFNVSRMTLRVSTAISSY